MSTTIEDRVILLLSEESGDNNRGDTDQAGLVGRIKSTISDSFEGKRTSKHGFWESLDRFTGISSQRWRKAYARRQRPTPDMIEALAKLFPSYAFWLATGITDSVNGHVAPRTAQTFPERLYTTSNETTQYFRAQIELVKKLFEEGGINLSDDKERMYAAERTRPLAHWWDSALCDAAYKIAASDEYENVKKLWKLREAERETRLLYITKPEMRPWVIARKDKKQQGLTETPFLGIDPRTRHQDNADLFYEPQEAIRQKFARSVLNIAPSALTDEQVETITKLSLAEVDDYVAHHGIDRRQVFPFKGGVIRYSEGGLTQDEAARFAEQIRQLRKMDS